VRTAKTEIIGSTAFAEIPRSDSRSTAGMRRMNIAEEIGVLKKENNVAVLQSKRWNEILEKMIVDGKKKDLSEQFILRVFKAIHQESINHQQSIFKQ